jgi:hypothetical protein
MMAGPCLHWLASHSAGETKWRQAVGLGEERGILRVHDTCSPLQTRSGSRPPVGAQLECPQSSGGGAGGPARGKRRCGIGLATGLLQRAVVAIELRGVASQPGH